ncbi:hypothetical protein [Winogradskyella sp. PG-2]|uniref:hypothetical protein n=1 Tax=Winogradskyella sp. PG-2 TaxID=754409 RepID=UPI0014945698|nr:hypothetical protein [Winogradskyella sp. PG-2]
MTLTTVGLNDVYSIIVGGPIFTFFILLIGLGIVVIPTGIIFSSITKAVDSRDKQV